MSSEALFRSHIVALDLEMNQPSGRIIQIGAVVGDLATGRVLDTFSVLVDPQEPLSDRISALTGISPDALLTQGVPLAGAYARLAAWLEPFKDTRQLNPLTWGGGDSRELREQLALADDRWLFGRRWLDVKTVYAAWRHAQGKRGDGGLARSMTKLGLRFQGRKHDARDDALNTFSMYIALLRQFDISRGGLP